MRIITDHGKRHDGTPYHQPVRAELDSVTRSGEHNLELAHSIKKAVMLEPLQLPDMGERNYHIRGLDEKKGLELDLTAWLVLSDDQAIQLAAMAQEHLTDVLTRVSDTLRCMEMLVKDGHLPCITDPVRRIDKDLAQLTDSIRELARRTTTLEGALEKIAKQVSAPIHNPAKVCEDRIATLESDDGILANRIATLESDDRILAKRVDSVKKMCDDLAKKHESREIFIGMLEGLQERVNRLEQIERRSDQDSITEPDAGPKRRMPGAARKVRR